MAENENQMVITLEDIFEIDELARRVVHEAVEKISCDVRKDIVAEAKKRVGVEIDKQITAVVADAVEMKRQATNWMGEAKGEVTTLAEEIIKRTDSLLEQRVDEDGKAARYHDSGSVTMLRHLMNKTVDGALREAIEKAAESAGEKVAEQIPIDEIVKQFKAIVLAEEDGE